MKRPPGVLPFGWSIRYFFFAVFFFAAFLAAFFAGAFLAAFFVAICLFSLFDGLHRFCNCYIAVEECIDSLIIDVKKKTKKEWKKEQQFLKRAMERECMVENAAGFDRRRWRLQQRIYAVKMLCVKQCATAVPTLDEALDRDDAVEENTAGFLARETFGPGHVVRSTTRNSA